MNARREIERLLPPFVFTKVTLRAVSRRFSTTDTGELDPDTQYVVNTLRGHIDSVVAKMAPKHQPTFARRLERAADALLEPLVDRKLILAFVTVLEWLQELVNTHRWEYPEDRLAEAIQSVLDAVSEHMDLVEVYEKSARKLGRKMLVNAQKLGYYTT